jgi:hypothetical protein
METELLRHNFKYQDGKFVHSYSKNAIGYEVIFNGHVLQWSLFLVDDGQKHYYVNHLDQYRTPYVFYPIDFDKRLSKILHEFPIKLSTTKEADAIKLTKKLKKLIGNIIHSKEYIAKNRNPRNLDSILN